jgi:hypothetical protein
MTLKYLSEIINIKISHKIFENFLKISENPPLYPITQFKIPPIKISKILLTKFNTLVNHPKKLHFKIKSKSITLKENKTPKNPKYSSPPKIFALQGTPAKNSSPINQMKIIPNLVVFIPKIIPIYLKSPITNLTHFKILKDPIQISPNKYNYKNTPKKIYHPLKNLLI